MPVLLFVCLVGKHVSCLLMQENLSIFFFSPLRLSGKQYINYAMNCKMISLWYYSVVFHVLPEPFGTPLTRQVTVETNMDHLLQFEFCIEFSVNTVHYLSLTLYVRWSLILAALNESSRLKRDTARSKLCQGWTNRVTMETEVFIPEGNLLTLKTLKPWILWMARYSSNNGYFKSINLQLEKSQGKSCI